MGPNLSNPTDKMDQGVEDHQGPGDQKADVDHDQRDTQDDGAHAFLPGMDSEFIGPLDKYAKKDQDDHLRDKIENQLAFLGTSEPAHLDVAVFPGGDHSADENGPDHDKPG